MEVTRDARFVGVESFYVRHGDWFVAVSALLAGFAAWRFHRPWVPPAPRRPVGGGKFRLD